MRIVYLPLDERFCTREYFLMFTKVAGLDLLTPTKELLGSKKVPSDTNALENWLLENVQPGDSLIISLDTLIHGGLIPSRINLIQPETIRDRLKILSILKEKKTKIYLSTTITRIPIYNSADEEPDYWEYYGETLSNMAKDFARYLESNKLENLSYKNILPEFLNQNEKRYQHIPEWMIKDFFWRRERNYNIIREVIELVNEGIVDFLNLTLDDNSAGSLSVYEAQQHKKVVKRLGLEEKVSIHPGADETSLTLLSRLLCSKFQYTPSFELFYVHPESINLIPPYEGYPLKDSVENHIKAAGAQIKTHGEIFLLLNNATDYNKYEVIYQDEVKVNEEEYDNILKRILGENRIVGVADIRYGNGADKKLVEKLLQKSLNWKRTNYAGWNTVSNTLGTVIIHSIIQYFGEKGYLKLDMDELSKLQAIFFIEHWGYQADVRQQLRKDCVTKGCNVWTLMPAEKWAEEYTCSKLLPYKNAVEKALHKNWEMKVFFPWHRSFEVGIVLS